MDYAYFHIFVIVLVFKDNIIKQERLRAASTVSLYKAEQGNYREQLRDVLKEYNNEFLLGIGSLGIENQSTIDKYIPIRVMGYDYTHYRSQMDRQMFPILPVITIVLNFSDKPWNNTKNLYDIMTLPQEFKSYIQDYKVMIYDIAFLEDEVIEQFSSDFKLIAKFFKDKRLGKEDFLKSGTIKHVQEFIDFLKVFTDDERYSEIKDEILEMQKKGRTITLCTVAQKFEERGIKKRIEKGIEKGKIIALYDLYKNQKLSLEDVAEEASMSVDNFLATVRKYANEN